MVWLIVVIYRKLRHKLHKWCYIIINVKCENYDPYPNFNIMHNKTIKQSIPFLGRYDNHYLHPLELFDHIHKCTWVSLTMET